MYNVHVVPNKINFISQNKFNFTANWIFLHWPNVGQVESWEFGAGDNFALMFISSYCIFKHSFQLLSLLSLPVPRVMANFDFVRSAATEELDAICSNNLKILLSLNQTWMGAQSKFRHINLWRGNNSSEVELILSGSSFSTIITSITFLGLTKQVGSSLKMWKHGLPGRGQSSAGDAVGS